MQEQNVSIPVNWHLKLDRYGKDAVFTDSCIHYNALIHAYLILNYTAHLSQLHYFILLSY